MKRRVCVGLIGVVIAVLFAASARSEVGDPTLRTDHPFYAGEGAFQTAADVVAFATEGASTSQARALALYNWFLTHQWHLPSPQEPDGSPRKPDTRQMENYELMVTDSTRARFSYGYGLCGTVHSWNEPYWKALGFNARRRAFPGHTNSEVEYDGSWHAFDTDMAGLIFRADGAVAGYEDVVADPTLILNAKPPVPCYPFDWPNDFRTMKNGWQQVAKGGNWYKMYHSGFEAHPGVLHLRAGESFTRYYDRDHFGGPTKRRFWHHQPGGPERYWSFVNQGTPKHVEAESNARGRATYCNGEFIYSPDFKTDRWREGAVNVTANVTHRAGSPMLYSRDGQDAACTFTHFSPYVICGDPVDDANPMTGTATGGLVISGVAKGQVSCEISLDQGQSWLPSKELPSSFELDLTDLVKGHYGWHCRFRWTGNSGLDALKFTTVTQVCQTIYPRLREGGSKVTYRCKSRGVSPVLPNFALAESQFESLEVQNLRSKNVRYAKRTPQNRSAYQTTNNKPGEVVFRMSSPEPLLEMTAAFRFTVPVPPPPNCDFHCDYSVDEGATWHELARAEIPSDNEFSSGWMYGRAAVGARVSPGSDSPATTSPMAEEAAAKRPVTGTTCLIRAHFYAGGRTTGLIDAQAYGLYRVRQPQSVSVTYAWKEGEKLREHHEAIPAGVTQHEFVVPTGSRISDEYVRLEVP